MPAHSASTDANPYQLTALELNFLELMAKGFDDLAACRSLGISFERGRRIHRRLGNKLRAADEHHLRRLVVTVQRTLPADRFAVLDNC